MKSGYSSKLPKNVKKALEAPKPPKRKSMMEKPDEPGKKVVDTDNDSY